jgi:hypothetical protein
MVLTTWRWIWAENKIEAVAQMPIAMMKAMKNRMAGECLYRGGSVYVRTYNGGGGMVW